MVAHGQGGQTVMRRTRRGARSGHEFGGSGEDSFVAVVVTKLTGALLFILLLSLVIVALVPKADEAARRAAGESEAPEVPPLAITTPASLPEAIAGRPYHLALAATGGRAALRWSLDGVLPKGLGFDPEIGTISGTPEAGTPEPVSLVARVVDGSDRAATALTLVVYQSDAALSLPSRWKPALPPVPWKAWLDQGFGFLVLLLVYLTGRGAVGSLERWSASGATGEGAMAAVRRRFVAYRAAVTMMAVGSASVLAIWLWRPWGQP